MAKKYQAIIDLKTDDISWTEAARQAGYPGRWTSDGKGGVKQKSSTQGGQARRRRRFDQPSTETAGAEARRLEKERIRINREAEMFGLEPTQIEHLADQSDSKAIKFGAAGDPSNKAIVRASDARAKDRVKLAVGEDYAVTLDPTTESIKVIPKKYFDPLADPSTLPGVNVKPDQEPQQVLSGWMKNVAQVLGYSQPTSKPKPKPKPRTRANVSNNGVVNAATALGYDPTAYIPRGRSYPNADGFDGHRLDSEGNAQEFPMLPIAIP